MLPTNLTEQQYLDLAWGDFFRKYAQRLLDHEPERVHSYVLDWVEGIYPPRSSTDDE